MVVSDLHGDGRLYQLYRTRFIELHQHKEVDGLILLGDLIHRDPDTGEDASLEMVLDVLALQKKYGEAVIYLCGNHETPHIYTFGLSKGSIEYSPPFEHALTTSGNREKITTFFKQLPFYLRTPAGVALTHAGAFAGVQTAEKMHKLFTWDHQAVLDQAQKIMQRYNRVALRYAYASLMSFDDYTTLTNYFMNINNPADPHYDDLVRGLIAMRGFSYELAYFVSTHTKSPPPYNKTEANTTAANFNLLWDALFTKCEQQYPNYPELLNHLLKQLSRSYTPQQVLIAGHILLQGGHEIVAGRHFRLASGKHASPLSAGQYLIFDAAQPVTSAHDLVSNIYSILQ